MKRRWVSLLFGFLLGIISLSLVGCAAGPTASAPLKSMPENLRDAGFKPYTADTPKKMAYLQSCPKEVLVVHSRQGQVCYAFTDPATNTVYLGDNEAYWRLQQTLDRQERKIQTQKIESDPEFWQMWEDLQGGG